ncbi:MAG: hypothetical protein GIS02_03010 [Methanosarcinales archaeon]|uniref:Uncharacterized protein n=1 Tax=Candidatus Ethanoperedens thermophilum TaxID=2766897 RepID=A0A848D8S7_9EURY|nr:hypothetical protein [Candidatus Ethanoperedens thermophilum]
MSKKETYRWIGVVIGGVIGILAAVMLEELGGCAQDALWSRGWLGHRVWCVEGAGMVVEVERENERKSFIRR